MFKITDETRDAAVDAMTKIFKEHDIEVTDASVLEAFEAAVDIVKKQFGM
jgi:hypothetical protein